MGSAGQIRAAIDAAPRNSLLAIFLAPGIALPLDGAPIALSGPIEVRIASEGEGAMLDAQHLSRAFEVGSGATLRLHCIALANGYAGTGVGGGAIYVVGGGSVMVADGKIINSTTQGSGGAILVGDGGSVTVTGSSVVNSSAQWFGGAIYVIGGGSVTVTGSSVVNSSAQGVGGAIDVIGGVIGGGSVTVTGSSVVNSSAQDNGGAIASYGGITTIHNTSIFGNAARGQGDGGAIFSGGGITTIHNTSIFGNAARGQGGGVYMAGGTLTMTLTVVHGNTATIGANVQVVGGAFYYQLPAVAGHWLPALECLAYRESTCGQDNAECLAAQPDCSRSAGNAANGWRPGGYCGKPLFVQSCDWQTDACASGDKANCVLGQTRYLLPYAPVEESFPFVCAAGFVGSNESALENQTSSACGGKCPAGFYCPDAPTLEPLPCPPRHYCEKGAVAARPCPAGRFSSAAMAKSLDDCAVCAAGSSCRVASAVETACAAGTYSALPGQEACTGCAPGSFQNATGATACESCTRGYYCPLGASAPLPCDGGSFSAASNLTSAAECTPAVAGFFSTIGSSEPTPCPIGTFSAQVRSDRCTECPTGTTTASTGTDSLEGCVCKADQYDRDPRANATACIDCPYMSTECRRVGAGVSLESLPLKPGYWRSHERSETLRQCLTAAFCDGGADCSGFMCEGYCASKRTGPFCELCVKGFVKSVDGSCTKCGGAAGLAFVVPVAVLLCFIVGGAFLARCGYLQQLADTAFEATKMGVVDTLFDGAAVVEEKLASTSAEEIEPTSPEQAPVSAPAEESPAVPESVPAAPAPACEQASTPATSESEAPPQPEPAGAGPSPPSNVSERLSRRCGCTKERTERMQVRSRILISLIQVLNSLGTVFSISYPPVFDSLVAYANIFSLDLFNVMPLGCAMDLNQDHYLVMRTLIPLCLLGISFHFRWRLKRRAKGKRAKGHVQEAKADDSLADRLLSYSFILVYLLFPSNSAAIFATFQCETFDDPAQSSHLRGDFSVDCKSTFHQMMMGYAGLMGLVYPIGVPLLYTYLLFYRHGTELQLLKRLELEQVAISNRLETTERLQDAWKEAARQERSVIKSLRQAITPSERMSARTMQRRSSRRASATQESGSKLTQLESLAEAEAQIKRLKAEEVRRHDALPDYVQKLIMGYELRLFYFELIECYRKLAIVCLPVFFAAGSPGQLMFGLLVCFLTYGVHMLYNPYLSDQDDRVAQLCQLQIFISLLSSILLKYDPDTIDSPGALDACLSALMFLPILLIIYFESPLPELIAAQLSRTSRAARRASRKLTFGRV